MEYFINPIKNHYVDFEGKATRKQFWMYTLIYLIIYMALVVVDGFLGTFLISSIFALATFLPSIAIGVRRLHDTNRSGWWYLICLVPLVGLILIFFWIQESK